MPSTEMRNKASQRELTIEDLSFDPPQLPEAELLDIARDCYGVCGVFRRLEGERDQNCHIQAQDGRQYVLKVAAATEQDAVIDFQVSALRHIAQSDPGLAVPRVLKGRNGEFVNSVRSEKGSHAVRLLTWLPGIPYQDGPFPSDAGLFGVGQFLARLNRSLSGFAHPASTQFMPWDCTNGLVFNPNLLGLLSGRVRNLIGPFMERLEQEVYPAVAQLRSQVIHQDGHGGNLLRESKSSEAVAGMIDFGDMVHGPIACDLAVSLTHFIEEAEDPAGVTLAMCRGFHSIIPLEEQEVALLLDLVITRQVLILELFEFRRRNMINPPRFVTEDQPGVIASLEMLLALDRKAFNRELGRIWK